MALDPIYWINLSRNGTFKRSGRYQTTPQDVDAIFAHLARTQASHLMLYFHGGLVSETSGMATAETLVPLFRDQAGTHPVFLLWESGWFEKIRDNLDRIGGETVFKRIAEAVLKFVVSKLKVDPTARGLELDLVPTDEIRRELETGQLFADYEDEALLQNLELVSTIEEEQLRFYLENDLEFEDEFETVLDTLATADEPLRELQPPDSSDTASERTLLSGEVLDQVKGESDSRGLLSLVTVAKMAAKVFFRVVKRLIAKTDHGVYCTTVEEILRALYVDNVGQWLWGQMKEDTRQAFESNEGLAGEALHGGTYFLEGLRRYLADPAHRPLKVSLVGHSAGSIFICNMLGNAAETFLPNFAFHKTVMLAPAVDFGLFKTEAADHPERFRHFRMFALQDALEAGKAMVPVLYPRSLLYFVSGLLEGEEEQPIVGMQRFYTSQPAYDDDETVKAVRAFMAEDPHRAVWSISEGVGPGFDSRADAHGAFDRDTVTLGSVVEILRS